uniref:Uncharacterized protein n=1 Tax=Setaria viridis TaxID=4556 RepID=A0A4U6V373_SETVI|nr:hypothetical protein SEVIR_4G218201v2 [Setaria viridis]
MPPTRPHLPQPSSLGAPRERLVCQGRLHGGSSNSWGQLPSRQSSWLRKCQAPEARAGQQLEQDGDDPTTERVGEQEWMIGAQAPLPRLPRSPVPTVRLDFAMLRFRPSPAEGAAAQMSDDASADAVVYDGRCRRDRTRRRWC